MLHNTLSHKNIPAKTMAYCSVAHFSCLDG